MNKPNGKNMFKSVLKFDIFMENISETFTWQVNSAIFGDFAFLHCC